MWYKETGLNPLVIGWAQEKGGQLVGKKPSNAQKWHKIRTCFSSPVLKQDTAKAFKA